MKKETVTTNEATKASYKRVGQYIDVGLRSYMLKVFSYMSVGLGLTAMVAYLVSISPSLVNVLYSNPLLLLMVAIAPLGLSIYLMSRISKIPPSTARTIFFVYAGLLGVALSSVFLVHTTATIATAFFVTSSMFLAMVIYGYTTGRDLTNVGAFMIMGLFGIIVASLINFFTRSPIMELAISVIGVIIFTGLTAYDTQKIKSYYLESDDSDISEKKAIIGALHLYLDFINLFLFILRLLNSRSR